MSGKYPIVIDESVMSPKEHGTCPNPPMKDLRWNVDRKTTDKICCFNRHYAEYSGYFAQTDFISDAKNSELPIKFHDPITGKVLYNCSKLRGIANNTIPFSYFLQRQLIDQWIHFCRNQCHMDGHRFVIKK